MSRAIMSLLTIKLNKTPNTLDIKKIIKIYYISSNTILLKIW